ncbi:hypothetical protein [Micromonospora cremea]|uniref:hypothetical protein n=1 Tax=Micromonospora cremea TaxID=709881 RepID=UPI0011815993|nr:hypothetical protein [Micromonospora cremea]
MSSVATPTLVSLSRTRRKLAIFTALTVVALVAGLPGWTIAALALTSLTIPLAVALAGGRNLLRDLLRPRLSDTGRHVPTTRSRGARCLQPIGSGAGFRTPAHGTEPNRQTGNTCWPECPSVRRGS